VGKAHRVFLAALEKAEITDFRWHDLRHTFASRLAMAGVDLRTVQDLMGHQTMAMTQRDAHLSPEHKLAAVQLLARKPSATTTATETKEAKPAAEPSPQAAESGEKSSEPSGTRTQSQDPLLKRRFWPILRLSADVVLRASVRCSRNWASLNVRPVPLASARLATVWLQRPRGLSLPS
jgi:hypothetical protein